MALKSTAKGLTSQKSSASCPNSAKAAHTSVAAPKPLLTQEQQRAALASINIRKHSPLMRAARYYAAYSELYSPDDLLQEALLRALVGRRCPAHVRIEPFIKGIMRSIASWAAEKRAREPRFIEVSDLTQHEQLAISAPSPLEYSGRLQRAAICQSALDAIADGDVAVSKIIDGIGQELRGAELAEFAGMEQGAMGTVQRRMKRRGVKEWARLAENDTISFDVA